MQRTLHPVAQESETPLAESVIVLRDNKTTDFLTSVNPSFTCVIPPVTLVVDVSSTLATSTVPDTLTLPPTSRDMVSPTTLFSPLSVTVTFTTSVPGSRALDSEVTGHTHVADPVDSTSTCDRQLSLFQ